MADQPTYKWTDTDGANEADVAKSRRIARQEQTAAETDFVTPYGYLAGQISGAKGFKVGVECPIDLSVKSFANWHITRFDKSGYVWEPIDPNVFTLFDVSTLGKLCDALHKWLPLRYGSDLYGPDRLHDTNMMVMPRLLFDHWRNTSSRYDALAKGKVDYRFAKAIPVDEGAKLYALARAPTQTQVPASIGTLSLVLPDDDIRQLRNDAADLALKASRVRDLLRMCAEQMERRAAVVGWLGALYVVAKCSATAKAGGSRAALLAAAVAKILPAVREKMFETPVVELLHTQGDTAQMSDRMKQLLAGLKPLSSNMAAEIGVLCKEMKQKLLEDPLFTQRCQRVFRAAAERKELQTPAMQEILYRVVYAMKLAALVQAEYLGPSADAQRFLRIHGNTEAKPAELPDRIKGDSAIEVILSVVGHGAVEASASVSNAALQLVGNLAGPPSLSIAVLQVGAAWAVGHAAKAALGGSSGAMTSVRKEILACFAKYDGFKGKVEEFKAAAAANDQAKMFALRNDFSESVAGKAQTSTGWKVSTNVLQIFAFVCALSDAESKAADPKTTQLELILSWDSAIVAGLQAAAGTVESVLTFLGKFESVSSAFARIGNTLGLVGAILGVCQGVLMMLDAADKHDAVGAMAGWATAGGSLCMIGFLILGASSAVGLGLAVAAAILILVAVYLGLYSIKGTPTMLGPNQIALGILAELSNLDFYLAIRFTADFRADFDEIMDLAANGSIDWAVNTKQVVDSLKQAGLNADHIKLIVNTTVPPDDLGGAPMPLFEPPH